MADSHDFLIQFLSKRTKIFSICDDLFSIGAIAMILLRLDESRKVAILEEDEQIMNKFIPSNKYKKIDNLEKVEKHDILIFEITSIHESKDNLLILIDLLVKLAVNDPTISCLMLSRAKEAFENPFLRGISQLKIYKNSQNQILECGLLDQATTFHNFTW